MFAARRLVLAVAVCCHFIITPRLAHAQPTPADSAAVLYAAAVRLDAEGNGDLAVELLAFLRRAYPGTPAAARAEQMLSTLRTAARRSGGRAGFVVWNTIYGAWLGLAVPAAFGADNAESFGAGLLIGGPAGLLASKYIADHRAIGSGQAIGTSFGSIWGTWQGIGWREVLDIGTETDEVCFDPGTGPICQDVERDSDTAPFAAALLGGAAGLVAGGLLGRHSSPGDVTLAAFGGLWGTWYGSAFAAIADVNGSDHQLTWALIGGNAGLLGAALAAGGTEMSAGRVWVIGAAGLAGGVAGVGMDLLFQVDDSRGAVLIPTITSAAGLIAGALLTHDRPTTNLGAGPALQPALVNLADGRPRLGVPMPIPTVERVLDGTGDYRPGLGLRVSILSGRF